VGAGPIVARSLGLLRASGIDEIILVAGWRAELYGEFLAGRFPEVRMLVNTRFAETGSLASLRIGMEGLRGDILVAESDILYEARGLSELLGSPSASAVLTSGPTKSGDEVWAYGSGGRLSRLDKASWDGAPRAGELVGLARLSAACAAALARSAEGLGDSAHYEDGISAVCGEHEVALAHVPDLAWCEVDTPQHLARARSQVWPRIAARDSARMANA
jgi:choline kinase